jgi:choline kinase
MKAVILAAGKGSRLGDLTEETPKSLLPLNNSYTLLDYNILLLKSIGIEDIVIVTGFASEKIENHVSALGVRCIYNPFWDHCNVLGSLYMALPHIHDDFLFLHADTLVDREVWLKLSSQSASIALPYVSKSCGEEEMKIRINDHGQIFEINKTMDPQLAAGEFLGIAYFKKTMISFFQQTSEMLFKKGELNQYMEEALQQAISLNLDIEVFDIGDADFTEVDFPEDYELAKKVFSPKFKNLN